MAGHEQSNELNPNRDVRAYALPRGPVAHTACVSLCSHEDSQSPNLSYNLRSSSAMYPQSLTGCNTAGAGQHRLITA
jgi:hypothetical protein